MDHSVRRILGSRWMYILPLLVLFGTNSAKAQKAETRPDVISGINYSVRSSIYSSTEGALPFWFYTNASGKVDPGSTNFLNEIQFSKTLVDHPSFSLNAGGHAVLRWSENSTVFFPGLYLRARAWGLQLDAGRFPQPIGLNNHGLSIGSMMVSNNAVPIPKISISTPDFLDVPHTNGHLQFKGMFSHGWFEEDRYVRNPYLHQKYLYLRVNVGPFSGTGGIVHNAQWGGEHPDAGRLPRSFGDYLRLITGRGAEAGSGAPGGEISNVIGNSVAAYEFGFTYHHNEYDLSFTRLFYLEDKVSTRFRSPWDGVWGANLVFDDRDRWLNAVTYEHINTKNQDAKSWELIGRRDYYDNFVYRSGWTYENRTLGLPLILFDGTTITNNVLVGHHLGFQGRPVNNNNLGYRFLLTYSRNYGVQDDWVSEGGASIPKDRDDIIPREQFRRDQYSLLLDLSYELRQSKGLQLNLKLGTDLGEQYRDNLGVMLGVTWSGGY